MQVLLNGIIIGSNYALLAIGFTLIFSAVRFYHMLYGPLALLGVYLTWSMGMGFVPGMLTSAFLVSILSVICWQLLYKPLVDRKASSLVILVSSFGGLIVLQNLIALYWGNSTHTVSLTDTIMQGYSFWGLSITWNQIAILIWSVVFMIILDLFLVRTKWGMAIRAIGDDPKLTTILGLKTNRVIALIFFIGTFLSVISGHLFALEIGFRPVYSLYFVLKAIIAAIIGGVGSIRGALFGGLLLGIVENFGIQIFGAVWQDVTAFVLLTLFLLFRPDGLFKARVLGK